MEEDVVFVKVCMEKSVVCVEEGIFVLGEEGACKSSDNMDYS